MTIEKVVPDTASKAAEYVLSRAEELGFVKAAITGIEKPARYDHYQAWLTRGDHGDMAYMEDAFHKRSRADMRELLPGVKSAIIVALSYPKEKPRQEVEDGIARGRIAQYALGDDYHYVIKKRLALLAESISEYADRPIASRACVDSAPLLERELAERAGMGFIGKNTMLIAPGIGSYFLLGVLLTELPLKATIPESTQDCGTCTLCLDACPTQAFREPYSLNASRCISYLTIESREVIPDELRSQIGDRVFGCDECQSVCPYNGKAPARQTIVPEMRTRDPERARPSLRMLANQGSNQRKRYVDGSPLRRNNRQQWLRNVAVALKNAKSRSPEDRAAFDALQSDRDAIVREHT